MNIRHIAKTGTGVSLCLLALGLLPGSVHAAPCVATTVGGLVGSTCTIGDMTFSFASAGDHGAIDNLLAEQFQFTPNASNPLSPSFSISAPITQNVLTISDPNAYGNYFLAFTASLTNGLALLNGLDVAIYGSVSGGTPTTSVGGGTILDATNESNLALTPLVFPEVCLQSGGGPSACVPTDGAGSDTATGIFTGGPVSTEDGMADWLIATDATGTATFVSASYSFDLQQPQIPEPTSLALMGGALIGLGFSRRRPD